MATSTDEKDRHLSVAGGGDDATVEELAEKEPETPPTQLAIPGTRDRVTATIGGAQPTESELRIMGGRRPIVGEYAKGESVTVIADTRVREISLVDHDDDWGTVSKTTRVHKARMLGVRPATPTTLLAELMKLGFDDKAKLGILFDEVMGG